MEGCACCEYLLSMHTHTFILVTLAHTSAEQLIVRIGGKKWQESDTDFIRSEVAFAGALCIYLVEISLMRVWAPWLLGIPAHQLGACHAVLVAQLPVVPLLSQRLRARALTTFAAVAAAPCCIVAAPMHLHGNHRTVCPAFAPLHNPVCECRRPHNSVHQGRRSRGGVWHT